MIIRSFDGSDGEDAVYTPIGGFVNTSIFAAGVPNTLLSITGEGFVSHSMVSDFATAQSGVMTMIIDGVSYTISANNTSANGDTGFTTEDLIYASPVEANPYLAYRSTKNIDGFFVEGYSQVGGSSVVKLNVFDKSVFDYSNNLAVSIIPLHFFESLVIKWQKPTATSVYFQYKGGLLI